MGFWDAFSVYNRKKHVDDIGMYGTNHSNIGSSNTSYAYSKEYYVPKDGKILKNNEKVTMDSNGKVINRENNFISQDVPHMVDVSNLSQQEFKELYDNARKGEPNNRVNF
ncbi:Spg4p NDAI_0E02070 [Naumovozyma dairenensis CBS 421]|uniref:Stationary phase protein 4 n=1 Tax=Naumovozyma dairenensis (strain ATCC 10597 / BCRC 20456 / CBS 421 / NBRC 0211 / NRRL Y-12639) TaxID=1071378 RepID=G0WBA3_NAUDC|nr:hypothetical protein NDAI_0E02070 [Naumovozyma dairenensis CBS 421]CCD25023.1 hypothetical protein NDAI_0E02070 [Naumovozyma dairenensis CBS 421]